MDKPIYYKYRSLENFKFFIDILVEQRLYATTYENMNDAMEGIYHHHITLSKKILKRIKEGKELLKICSLSEVNNEPLLWAHYANGSRGVCIGVQITGHDLDKRNINYVPTLPVITSCTDPNVTAKEILTYKHKSWEYEQELRIFTTKNEVKVLIKEIIFGEKMTSKDKTLIRKLVGSILPDVKIFDYKDIAL